MITKLMIINNKLVEIGSIKFILMAIMLITKPVNIIVVILKVQNIRVF